MFEVLTRSNPTLTLTATSSSLTNQNWWEDVSYKNVVEWTEFTYDTLMSGWSHILEDANTVKGELEEEITNTQRVIQDENKVDGIALGWNIKSVRAALKRGADMLHPDTQRDIVIDKHGRKFKSKKDENGKTHDAIPDMAIFWRSEPKYCLAIGDNKTSKGWKFSMLQVHPSFTKMRPIRQITTYCMLGKTRYGWIMTDFELVACRVSFVLNGNNKEWQIECKSVPWSASGTGVLTVNLCIWWLGMMGTSSRYREIAPTHETIKTNHWWELRKKGKTVGYLVS